MADKKTIEISADLYQAFLELKTKVSEMAKDDTVTDEDLVWFMVQEISHGIMTMEQHQWDWSHECCGGWHHHDEDHECCGGGHCGC